jgi:hypothetical protein
MYRRLPNYAELVSAYPDKHRVGTKRLLDEVGGAVRRSLNDAVNTCAIRMSRCFNAVGQRIRRMPGLYQLAGKPSMDGRGATADLLHRPRQGDEAILRSDLRSREAHLRCDQEPD